MKLSSCGLEVADIIKKIAIAEQHFTKKLRNCDCDSSSFNLRNCDCRLKKSSACPPLTVSQSHGKQLDKEGNKRMHPPKIHITSRVPIKTSLTLLPTPLLSKEAKYVESWPNTISAWAGLRRFDIPVDRYYGVQSLLIFTSSTLESPTCHRASQQDNTY